MARGLRPRLDMRWMTKFAALVGIAGASCAVPQVAPMCSMPAIAIAGGDAPASTLDTSAREEERPYGEHEESFSLVLRAGAAPVEVPIDAQPGKHIGAF